MAVVSGVVPRWIITGIGYSSTQWQDALILNSSLKAVHGGWWE